MKERFLEPFDPAYQSRSRILYFALNNLKNLFEKCLREMLQILLGGKETKRSERRVQSRLGNGIGSLRDLETTKSLVT